MKAARHLWQGRGVAQGNKKNLRNMPMRTLPMHLSRDAKPTRGGTGNCAGRLKRRLEHLRGTATPGSMETTRQRPRCYDPCIRHLPFFIAPAGKNAYRF
jgi:hypothetical protein